MPPRHKPGMLVVVSKTLCPVYSIFLYLLFKYFYMPVACWVLLYFSGGASGLSTNMRPHNVIRLINEGRRHEPSAAGARFV
jgi:hypothetical protein